MQDQDTKVQAASGWASASIRAGAEIIYPRTSKRVAPSGGDIQCKLERCFASDGGSEDTLIINIGDADEAIRGGYSTEHAFHMAEWGEAELSALIAALDALRIAQRHRGMRS